MGFVSLVCVDIGLIFVFLNVCFGVLFGFLLLTS